MYLEPCILAKMNVGNRFLTVLMKLVSILVSTEVVSSILNAFSLK